MPITINTIAKIFHPIVSNVKGSGSGSKIPPIASGLLISSWGRNDMNIKKVVYIKGEDPCHENPEQNPK